MDKTKILYVGLSPNFGGIERFLINICKNVDLNKFEISFLIFKGKKASHQEELEKMGIKFLEITHRRTNYIQFLKDLKRVYKENDFDVIHFNIMSFDCFERIILANQYSKAKLVVHSHSSNISKKYRKTRILNKLGKFFTQNVNYQRIACGEQAGKWLFGEKEFLILNNGMEIEKFQFIEKNREEIRKEWKIDLETKVFGHVGEMVPVKNHKFLIDVFYEYQKMERNSKLILVGEGVLKSELEQQVQNLGLQDNVLFLGRRDDMDKIYSAMDIFIMPSLFEGFSISIMEAQANGLKCYTSANVSRESNVIGNVEFLSLEKSAKEWAKKIYETDNARDENAIKKIPDKFKIEETVSVLSKIYEEK